MTALMRVTAVRTADLNAAIRAAIIQVSIAASRAEAFQHLREPFAPFAEPGVIDRAFLQVWAAATKLRTIV